MSRFLGNLLTKALINILFLLIAYMVIVNMFAQSGIASQLSSMGISFSPSDLFHPTRFIQEIINSFTNQLQLPDMNQLMNF